MRTILTTAFLCALASSIACVASAAEPIALRDMGSFHIGGRVVEITGKAVKEVVFTPGGVPAKVDPNGKYQVEQMYVQYFLPQNKKGKLPLLLWHGGGLSGVTYETKPDGKPGWLNYFIRAGWDTYISDAMERAAPAGATRSRARRWRCRSAIRGSASALGRSVHGATTRLSARRSRARSSRPTPMRNS